MFAGHRRSVEDSQKPVNGEAFLHVATIIAGLIGGIVAVGFGQKPPPGNGASRLRSCPRMKKVKMRVRFKTFLALGRLVLLTRDVPSDTWRSIAGGVYAVVYFVWGIAAL